MTTTKKQDYIKNGLKAVYEEFYTSINQLLIVEKFFKILVEVTKGADLNDDLTEFIKKTKRYRAYLPNIIRNKRNYTNEDAKKF